MLMLMLIVLIRPFFVDEDNIPQLVRQLTGNTLVSDHRAAKIWRESHS
jgi:hypothetical protein